MKNKEDILAKWLNGELSDDELESLEGREALLELRKVTEEVDQWSMPKYNTDTGYQKMLERRDAERGGIERLEDTPIKDKGSNRFKFIALACLIGLLLYGLLSFLGTKEEKLNAPPGQTINYAFLDGSEVWLNDGSSIKYQKTDWSTQRSITLEGEALFEVSKGAPFTVKTPHGVIKVLGTQFNVRAWGNNLYVECYEGKVQVQSGSQLTILSAKESVSVIDGSMDAKQVINNGAPFWQNGMSRFYNDQLKVVCDELERQYQIRVDLRAPDRNFSGNFNHDDLEKALRNICRPLDLNYTISQDKKTVVIE